MLIATISNPTDSKVIVQDNFFYKEGQPGRSRSLGQKSWQGIEGLATKNAHVKYESPTSSGIEAMSKVKVF